MYIFLKFLLEHHSRRLLSESEGNVESTMAKLHWRVNRRSRCVLIYVNRVLSINKQSWSNTFSIACSQRPPLWSSGKASALRAVHLGSIPAFPVDLLLGRVIPVTSTLVHLWLPCQAHGIIGSVLGLVGLGLAYCDWVRERLICSFYHNEAAHTIA